MNRKGHASKKIQGLHFHHHSGHGLRNSEHDRWCVEIENIRWHIYRYENDCTSGSCVEMSLCDGSCLPPMEDIPDEVWNDIAVQIKTPPMISEVSRWIEHKKVKTDQTFNQSICSVCKETKKVHRNRKLAH